MAGSLQKRMRLPLIVAEAVRSVWPKDKPVFYRASVIDALEGGISLEDTICLARALKTAGVDVIDCSSRGVLGAVALSKSVRPGGFQVPLAEAVRAGAEIPLRLPLG